MTIALDGHTLTAKKVVQIARPSSAGRYEKATLGTKAREKIAATRAFLEANWMHDEAPMIYSFNTGVGLFKDTRVAMSDMAEYQIKSIYAHATGIGEPFAEEVTRATMLLRANAFASNYSGPRVEVVERLIAFLNAGLHPVIPQKGSVGASGDLAPLAHMSGALCGVAEAEIIYKGKRMPARAAIQKAGLNPDFILGAKDASALINGSTVSLALSALAIEDSKRLLKLADIAVSLSLECLRGELAAFDPRVHKARPHPGQAKTAANILKMTQGSQRCSEAARMTVYPEENRAAGTKPSPRIQDVYSLRCAPQVHGPVREALDYVDGIVGREMNSATDNPLIFENGDNTYSVISGGHFHGQYIAQAMDVLGIAMADLSSISERRLARLIDPTMSYGLPRNLLAGKKGLNTGFATVQCSMSALVMENRHLANPGSVDSIPGKSNAEDHVSNSTYCGRKARSIVENAEMVLAGEILMSCQALSLIEDLAKDHPIGEGSRAALEAVRKEISPALSGDRWYATEMNQAIALVRSNRLIDAVEQAVGKLG
eukprot:gene12629-12720_t